MKFDVTSQHSQDIDQAPKRPLHTGPPHLSLPVRILTQFLLGLLGGFIGSFIAYLLNL